MDWKATEDTRFERRERRHKTFRDWMYFALPWVALGLYIVYAHGQGAL